MPTKLELSDEHMQVIADALGNAPLRVALPVVNEINRQIAKARQEQEQEKQVVQRQHSNSGDAKQQESIHG